MKGIVFTEFIEMVDNKFGLSTTEKIIEKSGVDGVYTSIGTYPHTEMVQLVVALSEETQTPIPLLLEAFGEYLFNSFTHLYPSFIEKAGDALSFLELVQSYIHQEVRKLYPNAELPEITTKRLSDTRMEMIYSSDRSMGDLAVGLVKGCFKHFKCTGNIRVINSTEDGRHVTFSVEIDNG